MHKQQTFFKGHAVGWIPFATPLPPPQLLHLSLFNCQILTLHHIPLPQENIKSDEEYILSQLQNLLCL